MEGFSGKFLGGELASAGGQTSGFGLGRALLLPGSEIVDCAGLLWVLNPLDHLGHGDEVNIVVGLKDLIHPVKEGVEELRVILEPGGVEEKTKRSAVLVVVTVEVVGEEVVELVSAENVGAGVDHGASGEVLIDSRVLTTIELVHDHLPNGVGSGRALLQITVATVGHAEVHRVGPEGRVLQGGSD